MPFDRKALLFICLFTSGVAAAMCKGPTIDFVIKCEGGTCDHGFFARFQGNSEWGCARILDVKGDETIYSFDGELGSLKRSDEILNGIYALKTAVASHNFGKDSCLHIDDNGGVTFGSKEMTNCTRSSKLTRLPDYNGSLENVIRDMADRSRTERLKKQIQVWTSPFLMVALMLFTIARFRKPFSGSFAIFVFLLSMAELVKAVGEDAGYVPVISGLIGTFFFLTYAAIRIFRSVARSHSWPRKNT
jgi:hypothetical protein